jgi:hypothetical protein
MFPQCTHNQHSAVARASASTFDFFNNLLLCIDAGGIRQPSRDVYVGQLMLLIWRSA